MDSELSQRTNFSELSSGPDYTQTHNDTSTMTHSQTHINVEHIKMCCVLVQ